MQNCLRNTQSKVLEINSHNEWALLLFTASQQHCFFKSKGGERKRDCRGNPLILEEMKVMWMGIWGECQENKSYTGDIARKGHTEEESTQLY